MTMPNMFSKILKSLSNEVRKGEQLTPDQEKYKDIELEKMVGISEKFSGGDKANPHPWKTAQGEVIYVTQAKPVPENVKILYHAAKIDHPFKYSNLLNPDEMTSVFTMIFSSCSYKDGIKIPLGKKTIYCKALNLVLTLQGDTWYIGATPTELTPSQLKQMTDALEE